MEDIYNILGLEPASSNQEIKAAYRKLSKRFHPDVDPGNPELEERFKALQLAYAILKNPTKRREYDIRLEAYKISLEQKKTCTQNISATHSTTIHTYTKHKKNRAVNLRWFLKKEINKKDGYRIGVAIVLLLIIFLTITFIENRFYNEAPYLEPRNEFIQAVPLVDSMEFIKGFNDSMVMKEQIQVSPIKKH